MLAITESSVSAINRVQRKTAELGFYLFSEYSVVKDFDILGKTKVHLVRQCPAFEVCGQQQHKARPAKSLGSWLHEHKILVLRGDRHMLLLQWHGEWCRSPASDPPAHSRWMMEEYTKSMAVTDTLCFLPTR